MDPWRYLSMSGTLHESMMNPLTSARDPSSIIVKPIRYTNKVLSGCFFFSYIQEAETRNFIIVFLVRLQRLYFQKTFSNILYQRNLNANR